VPQVDLEWVLEVIEGQLAECLNVDEGVCDIWYLESHISCKSLMDLLYKFTSDDKYIPSFCNRTIP